MQPAVVELTIPQGTDWNQPFIWKNELSQPIDLTGYDARMQVRESVGAPNVLLECTVANGRLRITPAQGRVEIVLPNAVTKSMWWTKGVYDLELVDGDGKVTRLVEGTISVSPEVTRT